MTRAAVSLCLLLASGSAAALELSVGPVQRGATTDLTATGCTAGANVMFVAAGKAGLTCPPKLAVCFDLLKPKPVASAACAGGVATASLLIPGGFAPGKMLLFQALDQSAAPVVSDVETRWVDAWSETVGVNGSVGDWSQPDTAFGTTSGIGANHVTWDEEYLYVASVHPDVAFGGSLHWLTIYVGDGAGATFGTQLGSQAPGLAAPAGFEIRWKADDSYDDLLEWDGVSWLGTGFWLGSEGSALSESDVNQTVEIAIPWDAVGDPTVATVHIAWVYEGAGFESTYAGTPDDSFVDGYDPDHLTVLTLDRSAALSPVAQNP